jgi:hypothetical protein
MTVKIHFAGREPDRPLTLLAAAATEGGWRRVAGTSGEVQTARELSHCFGTVWSVSESIENCDVAVHAHGYEDSPTSRRLAAECRRAGKPLVVFDGTETMPPSRPDLGTIYRCSAFSRLDHERVMPVFVPDPTLEVKSDDLAPLKKSEQPSVGFCGFAGSHLQVAGLRLMGAAQKADGLALRLRVLAALRRDRQIKCDFRIRRRYLGRATYAGSNTQAALQNARTEFLANLFSNPYNVAMRGKGNHSNRHYEILAAGRIPLFVDTQCVLPLESEINWRSHMAWIEEGQIGFIGSVLKKFHESISAERFMEIQASNRRLWDERLRPEPFFRRVLSALAAGERAP